MLEYDLQTRFNIGSTHKEPVLLIEEFNLIKFNT